MFTSLQQGTIEGQENPYALIASAHFYEVQKFLNKTSHVRGWIYVCIGEKRFASLPDDLKKVVLDAGKEMQAYENKLFLEEEGKLEKLLKEKMTFVDVDQAAFAKIASEAVLKNLSDSQKEMYKKIQAVK